MATISSNNLGAQSFAPGKSRTAPPAVATGSTAGDIDDTSSRSNILSDKRMMAAAKERFYEELDAKDSKKKIKTRTIPSEYATSPSLSAAETAANLASSDAAVGAARDDATPTTTTSGEFGRSRHILQGNIERVNDQYRNALQALTKMNNKNLWA